MWLFMPSPPTPPPPHGGEGLRVLPPLPSMGRGRGWGESHDGRGNA